MAVYMGVREGADPGWSDVIDNGSDVPGGPLFVFNNEISCMSVTTSTRWKLNINNQWENTGEDFTTLGNYWDSEFLVFSTNTKIHVWGNCTGETSTVANWKRHFVFENGEWSEDTTTSGRLQTARSTKTTSFVDKNGNFHLFGQFWSSGTSQNPTFVYRKHYVYIPSENKWYTKADIPTNYGSNVTFSAVDTEDGLAILYWSGTGNSRCSVYVNWNASTNTFGSDVNISSPYLTTPMSYVYYDGLPLFYLGDNKFYKFDETVNPPLTYQSKFDGRPGGAYLTGGIVTIGNKIYLFYQYTETVFVDATPGPVEPKRVIRGWINARLSTTTHLYKPYEFEFTETQDQAFDPAKEYYEKSGTVYTLTEDSTMDPNKTYYEMTYIGYLVYLKVDDEYVLADLSEVDTSNVYYIKYPHKESMLGKKKIIRIFGGNSQNKPIVIADGSYWAMSNLNSFRGKKILAKEEFEGKLHILTATDHYAYDGVNGLVRVGPGLNIPTDHIADSLYFDGKWYVSTCSIYTYTWNTYSGSVVNGHQYYNYLQLYYYDFDIGAWIQRRIFLSDRRYTNGQRSGTTYSYLGNYLFAYNDKLYIYLMTEKVVTSTTTSGGSTITTTNRTCIDSIYEVNLKSDVKNLSTTVYDSQTGRSRTITYTLNYYAFKYDPVYQNSYNIPIIKKASTVNNAPNYTSYRTTRDILSDLFFDQHGMLCLAYYYSIEYYGRKAYYRPKYDYKGNVTGQEFAGYTIGHDYETVSAIKVLRWDDENSKFVSQGTFTKRLEEAGIELTYNSKTVYPITGDSENGYALFDFNTNDWYRFDFNEAVPTFVKVEGSDSQTPYKIPAESFGSTQGKTPIMFNGHIFIFPGNGSDYANEHVRRENPSRYF